MWTNRNNKCHNSSLKNIYLANETHPTSSHILRHPLETRQPTEAKMDVLKKMMKKPSFPICPNSNVLLVWRLFHALFVHATVLAVVYQACVDASSSGYLYAVIYLGDVVHIMNTLLLFLTACKNRGRIITDRHVIIKNNLNYFLVIDIISILPLEVFAFASTSVLLTAARLRLPRILRFIRVIQFFSKFLLPSVKLLANLIISYYV